MSETPPRGLPPAIQWIGELDGHLELLDQTRLPHHVEVLTLRSLDGTVDAIRRLAVRGAPAIGVAAGYGMVLGVRERSPLPSALLDTAREVATLLLAARPTAVNLRWAVERCLQALRGEATLPRLFVEATAIHADEVAMSERIGQHGKHLVQPGMTVLTHCNTGRLAAPGDGTALAPLFAAWRDGVAFRVLADETRPLLQGARLTALELHDAGIPVELLCDGAGPGLIARGEVQLVLVGADRIARNGDFANKVGTYPLALACHAHGVPFYAVAPVSTMDLQIADGRAIPIEQRDATEVTMLGGQRVAPVGVGARNPAFDITPASLVTGIVTDRGVLQPPFGARIKGLSPIGR